MTKSAFGVETDFSKAETKPTPKKKESPAIGAAITGAGAVTAGTGLVAGGIPGAKSNFASVLDLKSPDADSRGPKRAAQRVRRTAPAAKAVPGGILGFRINAHEGGTLGFEQNAARDAKKKVNSPADAFANARNAAKIGPEKEVMRNMRTGKKIAGAALIGGTAATAYGAKRTKEALSKSQKHSDTYNGALVGAGGAAAGISHVGDKVLTGQKKRWTKLATDNVDAAGKLVPGLAGREGKKLTLRQMKKHNLNNPGTPYPKTMYPTVSDAAIKQNPSILNGASKKKAAQAGAHRAAATQQRHFAEVYGSTAKVVRRVRNPSLLAAGVGAGGLTSSRLSEDKKTVKKSLATSAFGVEH